MSYEELLKIAGVDRLEAMDEQMQMLSPSDVGRKAYREIFRLYNRERLAHLKKGGYENGKADKRQGRDGLL